MQIQSWPTLKQCLSVMVFTRICALLKTLSWWLYLVPPLQVAPFWTDKHQYIQINTPFIFICPYKRVLTIFFIIERPFILISKQFHTTLLCVLAVISISKGTISTNKNSYFVLHTLRFMSKRSDLPSLSTLPSVLKIEQPTMVLNRIITEIVLKMVLNYL